MIYIYIYIYICIHFFVKFFFLSVLCTYLIFNSSLELEEKIMGSRIELFRIGVYIFFPVAVFYYFNNPEFFEEYVLKRQKSLYPPDDKLVKLPKTKEGYEQLRIKLREERLKAKKE